MPQPQPRQQSRFNEIQMLQRQIMFKQLQELQRQQQFQDLGDARQQHYVNQQTLINKQASGAQFSPLINGTPVRDASQIFMFGNANLVHHGTSPVVQGFPNGLAFPQAQNQAMRSMGLVSHQVDGASITSPGNSLSPYSHFQGASHDTATVLNRDNSDQAEKSVIHSSAFSKSLMNDQGNDSSNQICTPDGAFVPKQELQEKNLFGQVFTQGLDSGVQPGDLQQVNNLQRNASLQHVGGRQEQGGWTDIKMGNMGPSQDFASLDPLEQKILFNMDDNDWEASFGRRGNMGTGGFGSMFESTDQLSAFPSVQSGSWSALMQSAVAEASSSDTGLQEEWSGLSFQNPELSNDNQPSNFVESGKQPTNWVDNNLQSPSSLSSKPEVQFNNTNSSSIFPGFQHYSGIQFPFQQKEDMRSDSSHESIQQCPEKASEWLGSNARQKQPSEGNRSVQRFSPLQNAWPGKNFKLESDMLQQNMSAYTKDTKQGRNTESQSPSGRENFQLNHFTEAPKPSTSGVGWETGRHITETQRLDFMNHVGRTSETMTDDHTQLCNSPRNVVNTYRGASETYETRDNCFQRENSSGSYHSNTSQHTIAGSELRENEGLHERDSCPMLEGDPKSSGQVLQGLSDNEHGHVGEFEFISNTSNNTVNLKEGSFPDIQRNFKASEEASPRSNVGSRLSTFVDRSTGFHPPNLTAQTSQNMLELIHKVDKFTEYRPGTYFGSTQSTSISEVAQAENASFAHSYDKSSASQYFGLRLAPPTQRPPYSNHFDSSKSSTHVESSSTAFQGPQYDRSQHHNQVFVTPQSPQGTMCGMGGRLPAFNPATSQETSLLISANPYGQQLPTFEAKQVIRPPITTGMSQQDTCSMKPPNVWVDVPTQQHPYGMQSHKVPLGVHQTSDATNGMMGTAGVPKQLDKPNYFKGDNSSQEIGAHLMNLQGSDYPVEHPAKERPEMQMSEETHDPVSLAGKLPAVSVRDLEAFGRSLKQSQVPPQRSFVLNSMHSDPGNRLSVKNNSIGSDMRVSQLTAAQINSFSYVDNKMLPISSVARIDQSVKDLSQPLLQDTSKDLASYNQYDSQGQSASNDVTSDGTGRSQFNFTPSWFKNYGTLKNGQMLPMYDPKIANNAAQQFSDRKSSESLHMNSALAQVYLAGASQVNNVWPATVNNAAAFKQFSSPYVLQSDCTDQNLVILRPKKRKFTTIELLPWNKEVTQGSSRPQNISTSELEWAQAANRLTEKLKDETEVIEDALLMVRPKKRLILTTQLMQQLFRPPPATILSENVTSNSDTLAYFAARLALGDACSLASHSHTPCQIHDLSSAENRTSESVGDRDFPKIVEDFINRSEMLEGELLRLEKGESILDMTVEFQDLEKFSVINRFAKFHSRGQLGVAETTSSATSSPVLKLYPQRYVIAMPMPKMVPEGQQFLSL